MSESDTETEKPKPPVLGSNITPGKGGDEGLLFLEDLQNLDLQQLTSQLIQPLEKLDVGTSEVGTLNVQNLTELQFQGQLFSFKGNVLRSMAAIEDGITDPNMASTVFEYATAEVFNTKRAEAVAYITGMM